MDSLISALPLALLFLLMLWVKMPSHWSAALTLALTVGMALWVMPGLDMTAQLSAEAAARNVGWSVVEGVLKAVFPILLIILGAIFSYNVVVESGAIHKIKEQFTLDGSRGLSVLMMVWGFGGLLEGMAGFGTAVAIPAAMLIGLGYKPVFSALVSLLGNTVSTGFGAVGVPVTTLCNEISATGAAPDSLVESISGMVLWQLTPMFVLVPYAILMLTEKKNWLGNFLVALWVGAVSWTVQLICAEKLGAETPAIVGSLAAMLAILGYRSLNGIIIDRRHSNRKKLGVISIESMLQAVRPWSVYAIILALILISGPLVPELQEALKSCCVTELELPVTGYHFRFSWVGNAAFMLFLGSICGGIVQGVRWQGLFKAFGRTLWSMRWSSLTILCLIVMATVMSQSGMTGAIGTGLARAAGGAYPFFAPLVGAVGTFVTGSDTSSNILFGKLQTQVSATLGLGCAPGSTVNSFGSEWLSAANTTGATAGKMVSPQSIAIATAACDIKGKDDAILRRALPFAALYLLIVGTAVYLGIKT